MDRLEPCDFARYYASFCQTCRSAPVAPDEARCVLRHAAAITQHRDTVLCRMPERAFRELWFVHNWRFGSAAAMHRWLRSNAASSLALEMCQSMIEHSGCAVKRHWPFGDT